MKYMILMQSDSICDMCKGTGYGEHSNMSSMYMCEGRFCSETEGEIIENIKESMHIKIGSYVEITGLDYSINSEAYAFLMKLKNFNPNATNENFGKIINILVNAEEDDEEYLYAVKVRNSEILIKGCDIKLWER